MNSLFITRAAQYVISDPYFYGSMAVTILMGMFIGAIIYNGDFQQVKKGLISIISYFILIVITQLARIFPKLTDVSENQYHQPLAAIETIIFITIAYIFGMIWAVILVRKAHNGNISH